VKGSTESMVPNKRFTELLKDIEPSPTTKGNASSAHTEVRKHLSSCEEFADRHIRDFLAGSYARDTAIRPKKLEDGYERPDVDIIIVTNYSISTDPTKVLTDLSTAFSTSFKVERINKRSVRIVTSKAEMDIVPVIEIGTTYHLPDRDLGHFKETNPSAHNDWSGDQNTLFNSRFKPLVKLFKWWRRENKTGRRPKGFVLEVLVAKHAPISETHYGEAFAQMLENIYSAYGNGGKPSIQDPGLPTSSDILSKVSITDWKNFIERVRVHADYARRAQDEDDMEEATRLWRKLFGSRFKATANAAQEDSLTTYATAPAVTTDYVFPNAPATPNKPRGFA